MKKSRLPSVEVSGDFRIYYNDNNEEIAWFLIEDGKMTQAKFLLSDSDPQISNKWLRWNNGYYVNNIWEIHYDRVYQGGNAEICEWHVNDEMWMGLETIEAGNWKFVRHFSPDGEIFSNEIHIQRPSGKFAPVYVMMKNEKGDWSAHDSPLECERWDWEMMS